MAPIISIGMTEGQHLGAELIAAGNRLSKAMPPVVRQQGRELQRRVRERASGRPGPQVVTGDYRNSIQYRPFRVSKGLGAEVYSDAPQAFRLEYGFVGVDSLGRHYNQPPFPHFRPALASMQGEFYAAVNDAIMKALKR